MTRKPPFDEWGDIVAKRVPSRDDLNKVRSALGPSPSKRRRHRRRAKPEQAQPSPPPVESEQAQPSSPPVESEQAQPSSPPAEPEKAAPPLAEPNKPVRRGGNRVRYKPEPLERLIEQHPEWTNEQLRTDYEQETKALPGTPSLEWVKKQAPKLRRGMGIKE